MKTNGPRVLHCLVQDLGGALPWWCVADFGRQAELEAAFVMRRLGARSYQYAGGSAGLLLREAYPHTSTPRIFVICFAPVFLATLSSIV